MISQNSVKVWSRPFGVARHGVGVIALVSVLIILITLAAGESENLFVVDKGLSPFSASFRRLRMASSGWSPQSGIQPGGRTSLWRMRCWLQRRIPRCCMHFFSAGKARSWPVSRQNRRANRRAMSHRITPDFADINELERWTSANKYDAQAHYRVSSKRGLQLLAAVMKRAGGAIGQARE